MRRKEEEEEKKRDIKTFEILVEFVWKSMSFDIYEAPLVTADDSCCWWWWWFIGSIIFDGLDETG